MYNIVIFGIFGIGKSYFLIEFVERMIIVGIKVICFDLIDQYVILLVDFIDEVYQNEVIIVFVDVVNGCLVV